MPVWVRLCYDRAFHWRITARHFGKKIPQARSVATQEKNHTQEKAQLVPAVAALRLAGDMHWLRGFGRLRESPGWPRSCQVRGRTLDAAGQGLRQSIVVICRSGSVPQ